MLEAVINALPPGMDWQDIKKHVSGKTWTANPADAAICALAAWGGLDVSDYLRRYPDVADAGIDPITHLVKYGLSEKRFMRIKNSNFRMSAGQENADTQIVGTPATEEPGIPMGNRSNPVVIVYIADVNYFIPTLISIYSLYLHRHEKVFYEVNIIAVDMTEVDRDILVPFESDYFSINIIYKNNNFNDLKFNEKEFHVSTCALFKFLLPEIFRYYDKIIYLDCDTLIQSDLYNLFSEKIDDIYGCVVEDLKATYVYNPPAQQRIGLNTPSYFNSGVMLLNLKKMREENVSEQMLEYKKYGVNNFMDQDALNYVFHNKARLISFKYNLVMNDFDFFKINAFLEYAKCNEKFNNAGEVIASASILHFAGVDKPWDKPLLNYAFIWLDYFNAYNRNFNKKVKLKWPMGKISYWIKQYYYSPGNISNFPGYHEQFISGKTKIKIIHIDLSFANLMELPICQSPYTAPVYVTLTTTPKRLNWIFPTLYSLVNQKLRPEKIILWLAADEFSSKLKLPPEIERLLSYGLEVKVISHTLKAYNKLVPALKAYPDKLLVTCDDDIYYEKDWLHWLYESWIWEKSCIHSLRAREIKLGSDGKPVTYRSQPIVNKTAIGLKYLATGVGGVLYPPGCFHPDVFDQKKFSTLCPYNDDIWYWAMSALAGVKTRAIGPRGVGLIYTNVENELTGDTLCRINVDNLGNDAQLNNLIGAYPILNDILKA